MKAKLLSFFLFVLLVSGLISCNKKFRTDDYRGYYPDKDYKNHHYKDKKNSYVPLHKDYLMLTNVPISRREGPNSKYPKGYKAKKALEAKKMAAKNGAKPAAPTGAETAKEMPFYDPAKQTPSAEPPKEAPAGEPHQ